MLQNLSLCIVTTILNAILPGFNDTSLRIMHAHYEVALVEPHTGKRKMKLSSNILISSVIIMQFISFLNHSGEIKIKGIHAVNGSRMDKVFANQTRDGLCCWC